VRLGLGLIGGDALPGQGDGGADPGRVGHQQQGLRRQVVQGGGGFPVKEGQEEFNTGKTLAGGQAVDHGLGLVAVPVLLPAQAPQGGGRVGEILAGLWEQDVGDRQDGELGQFLQGALADRIEKTQRFHQVAEEVEPDGAIVGELRSRWSGRDRLAWVGREDVENRATAAELTGITDQRDLFVTGPDQPAAEVVLVGFFAAHHQFGQFPEFFPGQHPPQQGLGGDHQDKGLPAVLDPVQGGEAGRHGDRVWRERGIGRDVVARVEQDRPVGEQSQVLFEGRRLFLGRNHHRQGAYACRK